MDTIDAVKFVWWQGVVEDRNDPLQLGRCRVRILAYHNEDRSLLKTEELPWAYPLQDITSAAMSGIGHAPVGPVEGTWVMGFFRDGDDAQQPIMLGTFGGIPQSPPPDAGLFDPNRVYPLNPQATEEDPNPQGHGLQEPDTSRLARTRGDNSKEDPFVTAKKEDRELNVPKALVETTWEEPETVASETQYPFNHAFTSESGHGQEFDDTPDSERVHMFHKDGTFEELHPKGDRVQKIVGDNFEIVKKDDNIRVKGDLNIMVDQQARIRVENDVSVEVTQGNVKVVVRQGDVRLNVENGNLISVINGNMITRVEGDKIEQIKGSYRLTVGGQYFLRAGTVFIRGGSIFLN